MISINYLDDKSKLKQNAVFSQYGGTLFSNANDMKLLSYEPTKLVKFDQNGWIPDGTYHKTKEEITSSDKFGYYGYISNANGSTSGSNLVDITFENIISLSGIILEFYCHVITTFSLTFKDENNNRIKRIDIYRNKDLKVILEFEQIDNIKKITIDLYKTEEPYQYQQLANIQIGNYKLFYPDKIVSLSGDFICKPQSITAEISSINMKLKSDYDLNFEKNQRLEVQDDNRYFGTFYLSDYKKTSINEWSITADSALGLLDKSQFIGGLYVNKPFEEIVSNIFSDTDLIYSIQDSLNSVLVNGHIPTCTKREALQMLAFSVGANILDVLSRNVIIKKSHAYGEKEIANSIQMSFPTISKEDEITGVELSYYDYLTSSEDKVIYEGSSLPDNTTIAFENPMYNFSCVGGSILSQNANQIIVSGCTKITGRFYNKTEKKAVLKTSDKNIITVNSCTLITQANYVARLQELYTLLTKVKTLEGDIISQDFDVSQIITIDTFLGKLQGILTEVNYNFGNNFHRAKIKMERIE